MALNGAKTAQNNYDKRHSDITESKWNTEKLCRKYCIVVFVTEVHADKTAYYHRPAGNRLQGN